MRRVQRLPIAATSRNYLAKRAAHAEAQSQAGGFDHTTHWKTSRNSPALKNVLRVLQQMMGPRQRCMYCVDSHGCDIEHFRPKTSFQALIYQWENLLLCCTECGRFKGDRFPEANGMALLIDPSIEEPWDFLDFDPGTGNITARFDLQTNTFDQRGATTAELLQLDRREAAANGHLSTFDAITRKIEDFLAQPEATESFITALIRADEHGLLGWFFKGNGQREAIAQQLRDQHPALWDACLDACRHR